MNNDNNIFYFCQTGNWKATENCLKEGVSPDVQNSEGDSPLQISAANGFSDIVSLLLNTGASIDLPNNYGWTPLMHAARHGHSSTVALLLKMKARINVCNKLGLSPVVAAAWSGDLTTLRLLIEAGAVLDQMPSLNHNNECDLSAIMAASLQGHVDILDFLLMEGVLFDQVSPITGLSPLMLAACEGHKEIADILINHGTNACKTDICGMSALDLAVACCKEEMIEYLENMMLQNPLNVKSQVADIFQAIRSGDILKLKSTLKEDPNSVNIIGTDDNITPLMLASMLGHNNVVNLLVSSGADLNIQDPENGWTALMYAVFHRRIDTVQLLLELGSSVDMCAANGCTALDLARHTDTSDSCIIESLTSKLATLNLVSLAEDPISPSNSLDRQKLSGSERLFSRKSDSQIGLKYLAKELREHKVEAITPPLPPISYSNVISVPSRKPSCDKSAKPSRNSLRLPNLLKKYTRKNTFVSASSCATKIDIPVECVTYDDSTSTLLASAATETSFKSSPSPESQKVLYVEEEDNEIESCKGELTALLEKESLHKYVENFREQEVDMKTLQHLTKEDLEEIGIQSSGSQNKLLEIINQLQNTG